MQNSNHPKLDSFRNSRVSYEGTKSPQRERNHPWLVMTPTVTTRRERNHPLAV
jgi:hypothetical protein